MKKSRRTLDRITSHRATGSGVLSPTDTYAQTDWQNWSSTQYNEQHQTISDRVYFLIPSSGAGSLGINYGQSDYGYDLLEQRSRTAVWASATAATITRAVWVTPHRVASTWVGTDDTGATDANPAGTNSVQFVQAGSNASAASSVVATLTNSVTAGNTLVAYGCVNATAAPGSGAVSDSLGNTWARVTSQAGGSAAAGGAAIWVANITTGGAIAVTLSAGSAKCALAVAEYSGVVSASPVDASAGASSSAGTTAPASGSMTTANAGDLLFAGASQGNAAVAWTPGSGYVLRTSQGAAGAMTAAIEELLVSATGAYDAGFTMSGSNPWTAVAVALKSTAPSAGNNMVMVSSNVYDGGSAGGDGNPTQQTRYVDGSTTRVTGRGFDFRDREVNITDPAGRYTVRTLDNLGRATLTQLYASFGGNLIAQNGAAFDARARQYQVLVYAVDPATGDVGNVLTGNNWFDPSGNNVQQIKPGAGQVFIKSQFNGVNWVTGTYIGYNTGGTSYAQAQTVAGDIIVVQSLNTLDEVGNVVSAASFMRLNDADPTTAGALTGGNARILYSAFWVDGIDRRIASANYGAAASFTRPDTPPASSTTVLVNGRIYDLAGRVYQTTDPKSVVNQLGYDNANQPTQTIEDVGGLARTTHFTWTLDGQKSTMTAVNAVTGDQTTTWTHGTTLASSGVARSDLLASITFPDSGVVGLTYNRLSEPLTIADQRDTVRTFVRDLLGRETNDCVTTVGSDTDSTVLQIATAYEIRGMVSTVTSLDSATPGSGTVLNQVQLNYNTFAQLSQEYQSHSGAVVTTGPTPTPSVQYAYDSGASGSNEIRFNQLTYPDGRTVANSFGTSGGMNDLLNRIDTIQDTTSGTTDLASYVYLGLTMPVRIIYPEPSVWLDLWGGTSGVFAGLDLFNRVIDQRWQNNIGGTPVDIDRYKLGYDLNSNPQYKANVVGTANVAAGLDEYYANDTLNRLTDMQRGVLNGTYTGITGTPARELVYGLDLTGNWSTYVTATAGTTDLNQARTSNPVNEITDITASGGTPVWVTPAYDAAGNMTTMPQPGTPTSAFTAVYDAWKRMVSISAGGGAVGLYQYDGTHRRIVADTTETRHFYFTDSWQDIEQRVGTATTMDQQHVWGIRLRDDPICRDDAAYGRLYVTQDGNFSPTAITSAIGTPLERYYNDPYGVRTILDGSWTAVAESAYAWWDSYHGLRQDPESGLLYNRFRLRHPSVGSFLQRDPLGYVNGNGLYEICRSTLSFLDPTGLAYELPKPVQPIQTGDCTDVARCGAKEGWEPQWGKPEDTDFKKEHLYVPAYTSDRETFINPDIKGKCCLTACVLAGEYHQFLTFATVFQTVLDDFKNKVGHAQEGAEERRQFNHAVDGEMKKQRVGSEIRAQKEFIACLRAAVADGKVGSIKCDDKELQRMKDLIPGEEKSLKEFEDAAAAGKQ